MTNILTVLPDFDVKPFTHLLPSLEKALVSTADLLTLDALDVAKRAQVPPGEVKKLCDALLNSLHADISPFGGVSADGDGLEDAALGDRRSKFVTTLDETLDASLGGGISTGYLTEIVGESAAGKTQLLLTLLLAVQLSPPLGPGKSALYISTEAPLQTTRLTQILKGHPRLSSLSAEERPSLSRIQSTHIHDVEAQEHVLRYQVPVAIQKQNIGLLIIDSIAANYRAEFDKGKARKGAESFAKRSNQLMKLGALLRDIARRFNVAVVVANQVADRFTLLEPSSQAVNMSQVTQRSRPDSPRQITAMPSATMSQDMPSNSTAAAPTLSSDDPLALDHQQRFFSGWGDDLTATNLKTPSLGLSWTNQLATRIALLKDPIYDDKASKPGEDRVVSGWNRRSKVVFSAWCAESETAFEIWEGGVRAAITTDIS